MQHDDSALHRNIAERDLTYPRPDFDRSANWQNLNGLWDFAPDPDNQGLNEHWELSGKADWSSRIVVPFAWETPASQIGREWLPIGWYRRSIQRPASWGEQRTILHFGAVHYLCQVWLNGQWIGEHRGGYLPFAFDITAALQDGEGELIVRVEAPLDKRFIPHGKQRSRPVDDYDGCAFTASSGIWQTVWLEPRPATFIQHIQIRPTATLTGFQVVVTLEGPLAEQASITLSVLEQPDVRITIPAEGRHRVETTLTLHNPQLWSPHHPQLYHIAATLNSADGEDQVRSYSGLRSIEVRGQHILLNGERLFIRGVLDQGYWADSGYTAPDEGALRHEIELLLAAGYNLSRKHIKFEDPRWLYWADRLGLLVWEEPPCTGRYSPEAVAEFESQLAPMVARDGNHPCIVIWGVYNEEWGLDWRTGDPGERQDAVAHGYDLLASIDHSRPIIDDSGWCHVKTDILDWHYYDNNLERWNNVTRIITTNPEIPFGHQIGPTTWYETLLSVAGSKHQGLPLINGEYGGGSTSVQRGWHLRWQTQELYRYDGMSGYIYTEFTDVEYELCGIYDAQRLLKPLGCDPAMVNAESVIIFDLVPLIPGIDYATTNGTIEATIHLSHKGNQPLQGVLSWSWGEDGEALDRRELTVAPFENVGPITLQCSLPAGQDRGALMVRFNDLNGERRAYSFLDVVAVSAEYLTELQRQASAQKGGETSSESEQAKVTGAIAGDD